jgi:hypothetical protein
MEEDARINATFASWHSERSVERSRSFDLRRNTHEWKRCSSESDNVEVLPRVERAVPRQRCPQNQKKAMQDGELTYQDHDHKKMTQRMFRINDDLVYFKTNAVKFTMEETAEEVIPNSLKPTITRLEYIASKAARN